MFVNGIRALPRIQQLGFALAFAYLAVISIGYLHPRNTFTINLTHPTSLYTFDFIYIALATAILITLTCITTVLWISTLIND